MKPYNELTRLEMLRSDGAKLLRYFERPEETGSRRSAGLAALARCHNILGVGRPAPRQNAGSEIHLMLLACL